MKKNRRVLWVVGVQLPQDKQEADSTEPLTLFKPMRLKKRGGRKMVIVGDVVTIDSNYISPVTADKTHAPKPYNACPLLKALVRAHLWQRQLSAGKYNTVKDLAIANKVSEKYIQLHLRLNFLDPRLKEAIINEIPPKDLVITDLLTGKVELVWGR